MRRRGAVILLVAVVLAGCQHDGGGGSDWGKLGELFKTAASSSGGTTAKTSTTAKSVKAPSSVQPFQVQSVRGPSSVKPFEVRNLKGPSAVKPLEVSPTQDRPPMGRSPFNLSSSNPPQPPTGRQHRSFLEWLAGQPPKDQQRLLGQPKSEESWWHTWFAKKQSK